MMGRQSRQMAMVFVDMASLIPENHLLRKIDGMVSFDFIYGLLAPYYSATGRPSVDPVSMFKMLLVGYLYGIKSERRLVEEIRLNIAYRWFCGFELDDAIPDHSTFSKTRTRKWQQSGLFQNAFYEIVKQCIACGLIDGKAMAADGSYIPANVSRESWVDVETEVEQSMQSYLDALDEELSQQPGFKKPPERTIKKRRTTSRTDPDSGYINHGNKRGIGYLMEATVDCKHGILTGVDVYPANEKESLLVLRHLEQQIKLGVPMNQLALDRGYDTGAVHRGLELLGVTGYIPAIQFPNAPEKYGFSYNPQRDAFICPEGVGLTYHRLNCNQSTGKYLRCYQIEDDACKHCVKRPSCFDKAGIRRRVLASSCYPAFFRGHQRVGTPEFLSMMRLRKIWAEGSFSVLKREHCISKIRKRGILAATEECLLAAMALNLKRMASAVFFYLHISYSAGTTAGFGSFLAFVNGSVYIRNIMDGTEMLEVNPVLREKLQERGLYSDALMRKIAKEGTIAHIAEIPEDIRRVFVCAHDVSPVYHTRMQAAFQRHTDNAVSKTVNFPHSATREEVAEVYMLAYKMGCKGVTIYRDGSRDSQVLNIGSVKKEGGAAAQHPFGRIVPRPRPAITMGFTERMKIGCGNLYVTVNYDENGICEVFTSTGKAGGCPSQSEATARLASVALRSGISVEEVYDQLKGIRCPSTIRQQGMSCTSCPDAIAKVLAKVDRFIRENNNAVQHPEAEPTPGQRRAAAGGPATAGRRGSHVPAAASEIHICPECGGPVEHEGGCVICRNCGFSKCG